MATTFNLATMFNLVSMLNLATTFDLASTFNLAAMLRSGQQRPDRQLYVQHGATPSLLLSRDHLQHLVRRGHRHPVHRDAESRRVCA